MFDFGSPEDTAALRWGLHISEDGPGVLDIHWEEMNEEELLNLFVYLYIAVREAFRDDAPQPVIDIFLAQYDEVFEALAHASDEFRDSVRSGKHSIVLGYAEEHREKYFKLAGLTP